MKKENANIDSLELPSGILVHQLRSGIKMPIKFCEVSCRYLHDEKVYTKVCLLERFFLMNNARFHAKMKLKVVLCKRSI